MYNVSINQVGDGIIIIIGYHCKLPNCPGTGIDLAYLTLLVKDRALKK